MREVISNIPHQRASTTTADGDNLPERGDDERIISRISSANNEKAQHEEAPVTQKLPNDRQLSSKSLHGASSHASAPKRERSLRLSLGPSAASTTSTASITTISTTGPNPVLSSSRLRVYKSNNKAWVTREIAALDFLLGIPLQSERNIVHHGWRQQQGLDLLEQDEGSENSSREETKAEILEPPTALPISERTAETSNFQSGPTPQGRWWEKWISNPNQKTAELSNRRGLDGNVEEEELEQPTMTDRSRTADFGGRAKPHHHHHSQQHQVVPAYAPGRRLDGDAAFQIQIPLKVDTITRQRSIARLAATREWEVSVAHGIGKKGTSATGQNDSHPNHPPMLDGRLFFSASSGYPIGVFSLLKYEPKKEEAARRRKKLEARGGGGTQFFIMPERDWRGISYRSLLKVSHRKHKRTRRRLEQSGENVVFDRFRSSSDSLDLKNSEEDEEDDDSSDDGESCRDTYVPGLLDDPDMVQGRHRNVMIGDRSTGCIVASTIQFVRPELLKEDLNKQFRERFDGYEPPKSQRMYIGAKIVDGSYTLIDPDDRDESTVKDDNGVSRQRFSSAASISSSDGGKETIRMPPSLTLSKIRSIKHQALVAAVKARLEIGTVALAYVYFERLCLDCRVDKSNRRLSFAACLLLSIKINEAHVGLVMRKDDEEEQAESSEKAISKKGIKSLIRPTKKSSTMFASILEFFTQEWSISLKHLFAAEWQVFAALQFRLHATPTQVAFHFKRCMKALDYNSRSYLGNTMYNYWQDAIEDEEYRSEEAKLRQEVRKKKKEQEKLLQIQREIDAANRREKVLSQTTELEEPSLVAPSDSSAPLKAKKIPDRTKGAKPRRQSSRIGGIKLLHRFAGGKRAMSTDKLDEVQVSVDETSKLPLSPSMPAIFGSFKQEEGHEFTLELNDSPRRSQHKHHDKHGADSHSIGNESDEGIKF